MPYANISETHACLTDCIEYCEQNLDKEYCAQYLPLLRETKEELTQAWAVSDKHYADWRREAGEDKVTWKTLAKLLIEVQARLARIDAIGYPERRVMYWDEPLLAAAVYEMLDYLEEHADDIDFASDYINRMQQQLETARTEHGESAGALRSYQRFFRGRRDTLSNAYHVIGQFRDSIRRRLGKDHPDYDLIRWAWSVSPDKTVL